LNILKNLINSQPKFFVIVQLARVVDLCERSAQNFHFGSQFHDLVFMEPLITNVVRDIFNNKQNDGPVMRVRENVINYFL